MSESNMILIAHRGNRDGPDNLKENTVSYLSRAMDKGYDVEVDVWSVRGLWYLGHDGPEHKINVQFLQNEHVWCHAKNIPTLVDLLAAGCHCFFHDKDDATLTSKGFIWTYPGKILTERSVAVLPELHNSVVNGAYGVCSDFVDRYSGIK